MSEIQKLHRSSTLAPHVDGAESAIDLDAGRRAFLRGVGMATVGAGLLGTIAHIPAASAQAQGDVDILNFALNLEYLEAEFYLQAAFGRGLADRDTTGRGGAGPVRGGRKVDFDTKAIRLYAEEIADDEEKHVKFLRAALGSAAVARPTINILRAFQDAARAAGLIGPNDNFNAYANETNFLLGAFIFEDVGVTAYKGAAPLIQDPAILSAAAGILAVEAYHAGLVRTILFQRELLMEANLISRLRDGADGRGKFDQGIGTRNRSNIVPTDDNALAFGRTAEQVLSIVYLGGEGEGGFFPNGVNA